MTKLKCLHVSTHSTVQDLSHWSMTNKNPTHKKRQCFENGLADQRFFFLHFPQDILEMNTFD